MGVRKYASLTTRRRPDKGAIRRAHRQRRDTAYNTTAPKPKKRRTADGQ